MKVSFLAVLLLSVFVVAQPQDALAQNPGSDGTTIGLQGGKYGVGFTSSWPAYGISGVYYANQKISIEAVLGFLGTVNTYSGRLWYRFTPGEKFDIYGVAGAGIYTYDYFLGNENVLGLQGGAGIESGIQALADDPELPAIFFNLELTLGYANFEFYNFSAISFGAGIHYRFGQRN